MTERNVVVRRIPRVDPVMLDAYARVGSSTVHEALGKRGFAGPDIRPIQQTTAIAGCAVTVSCNPGDNLMIHAAVEVCEPGDILVVTNTGPSTHGMFGELLATSVMARGVRGLVIDAGVRDVAELRAIGFPVWSRFVSCQGTVKATAGSVNVAVSLGDLVVRAGDVVVADDDGVVVVPHEEAAECLQRSKERVARESEKRSRLAAGELSLDIDGLRQKLEDLGVRYVDEVDPS